MSLADTPDWLNIMVFGEPGSGKTHLLGTAVDHPDTSPLLILDIDGGTSTLEKFENHKQIDVISVRSYLEAANICRKLRESVKDDKLIYKTIGFDTASELCKIDLALINKEYAATNPAIEEDVPDQRSYYKVGNRMRKLVRAYRDLPCNTIFMAHLNTGKDNLQRTTYFPQFPGKLSGELSGFVDVVGYLRAEVKRDEVIRYLQVAKSEVVMAKDRKGLFDKVEENPTIPGLWAKLKESKSG